MASGVNVTDECMTAYQEIKSRHFRFCIFKLDDQNKNIVVDTVGEKRTKDSPVEEYEDFLQKLKAKDKDGSPLCRYAVYDMGYLDKKESALREKLVFMAWSPDDSTVKQKMIYSASRQALMSKINHQNRPLQANDDDDISFRNVIDFVGGKRD